MAVPKRKKSRSNTRARRSAWKAKLTDLQVVNIDGKAIKIPRRLQKAYETGLLSTEDI